MKLKNKNNPKWKLDLDVNTLWDELFSPFVGKDHHIVQGLCLAILTALKRLHQEFPEREYVTLGEVMDIVLPQTGELDWTILKYVNYLTRVQLIVIKSEGVGPSVPIKLAAFNPGFNDPVPQF